MRNRAKCNICKSIIESFHSTDYVECKCGEISVDGGLAMKCAAKNFDNFLRVDDEDHEIIPKIKSRSDDVKPLDNGTHKPSKDELLKMLDDMIENIERLPNYAMTTPIDHYDLLSALLLLSALFRADKA